MPYMSIFPHILHIRYLLTSTSTVINPMQHSCALKVLVLRFVFAFGFIRRRLENASACADGWYFWLLVGYCVHSGQFFSCICFQAGVNRIRMLCRLGAWQTRNLTWYRSTSPALRNCGPVHQAGPPLCLANRTR